MTLALGVGVPELLVVLFIGLFSVFWIWMLVDCAKNPKLSSNERAVWILVIVFLHVLGAAVYFFTERESGGIGA